MKRSYTAATTQEDYTQEDMPARRRPRSYSNVSNPARSRQMVVRQSRVPRPIRTRGTPRGYYEIPVTVYRRVYYNMSTGLWATDPYTAVTSGSTGYSGFALNTSMDTSNMPLGNGAITSGIPVTIPGFAGIQGVFEEGKIARIEYEFWFASQAAEIGGSLFQAPNIWVVQDFNNADPPASLSELLQYSSVKCIKGDINHPMKMTLYPKVRDAVGSAQDELGTTLTLSQVESPGYFQLSKPGAIHFGLRGWMETNNAAGVTVGYLCIKETQIRRYKITK